MTDESKLDERFRSHKWFLPAIGDVIRLMYHTSKTEGDDAIFAKAIKDGQFDKIYNSLWSATEYGSNDDSYGSGQQACACSTNGHPNQATKVSTHSIRPICMF